MVDFFQNDNDKQFTLETVGNIIDGRQHLGEDMPVSIYRLFQFTMKGVLKKRFGDDVAIDIFRTAGNLAGREFAENMLDITLPFNEFIAHLQNILREKKMGILRIEKFNLETGHALLTVSEDLTCSGLPVIGKAVCNYDEGFLAGILNVYTQKEYVVTEIDCWATGSRVCRFEATVKEGVENQCE